MKLSRHPNSRERGAEIVSRKDMKRIIRQRNYRVHR